jgi:alpha-L-rhamnosidase
LDGDLSRLVAPQGPPIRPTEVLPAIDLWPSASGGTVVDFGQNAVGWVRLRTRGLPEGTTVTVRHAEVLADGELDTIPLRGARATDTWVLRGPAQETLEPRLTLHGFRYAEVSGVPDLKAEDVELVVVGSDLKPTGTFHSSSDLLNRFHDNVIWSGRGNFVDVPTDCPQRDERLGWTGDIQVFAPAALFLFDTAGFLTSWLADLAAEQLPDGSVPHVVPDVIRSRIGWAPAAAWGDAATIVPWTIYERTGDVGVLEAQYDSMRAWVDKEAAAAGADRLWTGGFQYGDWLDPTAPDDDAAAAKADPAVVATAHLVHSAELVARAAGILGRTEDAHRFAGLAAEVRRAFAQAFITPDGRVVSDAQTVYALAIEWDLLPGPTQREYAGLRLAELVRTTGFHIATGFVGTPLVCDALTSTGHQELAYRLLLQTGCPSWLYPVTMGATTVWERWDSMRPDGTTNPSGMTSFNHYALGAVADWMHRVAAGLAPMAPGYREILVRPRVTSSLTGVSATHRTPYGQARVAWSRADGELTVEVGVPVGVSARVDLPGSPGVVVRHGEHSWTMADPTLQPVGAAALATIRDVLDDAGAWQRVVDASAPFAVDGATAAKRLAPFLDSPIAELPEVMTLDEWAPEAFTLRERLTEITAAQMEERSPTTEPEHHDTTIAAPSQPSSRPEPIPLTPGGGPATSLSGR